MTPDQQLGNSDAVSAEASTATMATDTTDAPRERRESMSQRSENSQTAADFLRDQMQLEADAREALPYVCLRVSSSRSQEAARADIRAPRVSTTAPNRLVLCDRTSSPA